MLCELSWEVVMMVLMRDENGRGEREVIVMKDDVLWNDSNQESNTFLHISSNEGLSWGS